MLNSSYRTCSIPFADMKSWQEVADLVDGPNGQRPPIDALPTDTPPAIVDMIKYCWHFNRDQRFSAMQCVDILQHCNDVFADKSFDIFLSHRWTEKCFVRHLYKHLVNSGYRVWYDEIHMGHDMAYSMQSGIEKSKVVLACVSSAYQSSDNTMFELRYARRFVDANSGLQKPIITVVLESRIISWANAELKQLCDIKNPGGTMYVDLSSVVANYPKNEVDARDFQVRRIFDYMNILWLPTNHSIKIFVLKLTTAYSTNRIITTQIMRINV